MAEPCVCVKGVTARACLVERFKRHGWALTSDDAECSCTCHDVPSHPSGAREASE